MQPDDNAHMYALCWLCTRVFGAACYGSNEQHSLTLGLQTYVSLALV